MFSKQLTDSIYLDKYKKHIFIKKARPGKYSDPKIFNCKVSFLYKKICAQGFNDILSGFCILFNRSAKIDIR